MLLKTLSYWKDNFKMMKRAWNAMQEPGIGKSHKACIKESLYAFDPLWAP